jgi:predicted acyltransferase
MTTADQLRILAGWRKDDAYLLRGAADELEKYAELYRAINELMAYMGKYGSAAARGDRAQAVMDALYKIDGGQYVGPVHETVPSAEFEKNR